MQGTHMQMEDLLARFVQITRACLGENLVGVYLHGSLAMGCFHPQKSDVDLLVVVKDTVADTSKLAYLAQLVALNEQAPPKGIEMSVVRAEDVKPFAYPTPYEFHFSPAHLSLARENPQAYVERLHGTDKDLAAHCTILHRYGVALYGPAVEEVFAPVPRADYLDSIWTDVENAEADIAENPLYVTLNLCRVLAYAQEGLVLSKRAGGEWGTQKLPEPYRGMAQEALSCYGGAAQMRVENQAAQRYAAFMLAQIRRYKE